MTSARPSGSSSAWRVGQWVAVRGVDEIMATLDDKGCVDGMPFMPEMLAFCGRHLQIVKSAHKTCDPTGATNLRKLDDCVHLDTRCDGGAHDGCGARCLLFWKTAWLKPIAPQTENGTAAPITGFSDLLSRNSLRQEDGGEKRYRCQATEIVSATTPLSPYDPRPYIQDLRSGNVSWPSFAGYLILALLREIKILLESKKEARADKLGAEPGHVHPPGRGETGKSSRTPPPTRAPLNLRPGEWVRIKDKADIFPTLNKDRKNYGLSFDNDMMRSCGKTRRVVARLERVIDEKTGHMRIIERDCIVMEGVTCAGLDCRHRLFCPRGVLTFWREAWLDRVNGN